MDSRKKPKVGFIPCLTFVKQGVAKGRPEKSKVSKEEMKEVVKNLRLREAEYLSRPKEDKANAEEGERMTTSDDDDGRNENSAIDDYYNMDDYDDEPVESGISYNTDAMLLSATESGDDSEEDSEEEIDDFSVKPDDNIIVAGQVSDDVCLLQLYVLNAEKQEFFLLNDTYLPTYPVAIEWMDYNPENVGTPGHYAAVGYMEPEIHIWDLDTADSLEPAFCLGSKKQKKTMRHKDAVMDLSWNKLAKNMLASSSADHTVILWDMKERKGISRLDCFAEKVQSVQWHPLETPMLVTGVCDGFVKLFDTRTPGTHKSWQFEGEIERVMWNKFDPLYFFSSTEKGMVHYVDIRQSKPVWNLNAHTSSVGGLALSSFCKDFMVTGSQDEKAKVWDIKDSTPTLVVEKQMNIGHIYALTACPDSPYVFAAGGAKPDNHLYIWDARDSQEVVSRFKDRLSDIVPVQTGQQNDESSTSNGLSFQIKEKRKPQNQGELPSSSSSAPSSQRHESAKSRSKKKKKTKKP